MVLNRETFASAFVRNPTALGVTVLHYTPEPHLQVSLEFFELGVNPLAKHQAREFIKHGFLKALTNTIGLQALPLGARVVDVLHR